MHSFELAASIKNIFLAFVINFTETWDLIYDCLLLGLALP